MSRGPYAKNFACLDCGAPTGRRDSRCPDCRAVAKRAYNRAYLRDYHERTRPAPAPRPQDDPALPPLGVLLDDGERVQCHVCGRWYGSLVTHIRSHGLDADAYKERYELARTSSLLGPAAKAKQRAAALARNQAAHGSTDGLAPRPKGVANRRQSRIAVSDSHRRRAEAP